MDRIQYRISKEMYEHILSLSNDGEKREYVISILPRDILMGYGFYGFNNVFEENGEYFADIWIGSTCD